MLTLTMLQPWYEGPIQGPCQQPVPIMCPWRHPNGEEALSILSLSAPAIAPKTAQNGTHTSARPSMVTRSHVATPTEEMVPRLPPVLTWANAVELRSLRNALHLRARQVPRFFYLKIGNSDAVFFNFYCHCRHAASTPITPGTHTGGVQ